ncbi:MAG TPA: tetratricopeptide repeat protein [Patescibacteria group bacterium]|nr:tetratricopeptide repeat protein [Patescibacteria group bacterium]
MWSREAVLLTALAALGIMFGITEVAVGFYHTKQTELAQMWFQKGSSALASERPQEAIGDFRNALSYDPDNSSYQLRLAQALTAASRNVEAESYLLDLWSREPGSGEINLELAQLEARSGSADAARYFDNAIYGVWTSEPEQHRWQARMQLFQFYRSRGKSGQAQAELLAMAADTPRNDYQRQTEIGQLQMESNNPRQALQQFRLALRVSPRYAPALAGAGQAEFDVGEYQDALPYLESAVKLDPKDQQTVSLLKMTRLVIENDPFQIGLDERQRTERSLDAYLQALSSLTDCANKQGVALDASGASPNALQQTWALGQRQLELMTHFRGQPQTVLQLMNFVFSGEDLAASECGPLQGKDQALWLIGKKHQLSVNNKGQGGA